MTGRKVKRRAEGRGTKKTGRRIVGNWHACSTIHRKPSQSKPGGTTHRCMTPKRPSDLFKRFMNCSRYQAACEIQPTHPVPHPSGHPSQEGIYRWESVLSGSLCRVGRITTVNPLLRGGARSAGVCRFRRLPGQNENCSKIRGRN